MKRIAIIGDTEHGGYGHYLDQAFAGVAGTETVAVADPNEDGRATAMRNSGATTGYADYRVARFEHTPEIKVRFMGDPSAGPRGCGEMPGPPAAAAISNAIYHATGVRFYDLPLTPEKVRAALAAA